MTWGGRWILYIGDRQTRLSTQITEDGVAVSKSTRHSDAHKRDPGQKGASHFVLHFLVPYRGTWTAAQGRQAQHIGRAPATKKSPACLPGRVAGLFKMQHFLAWVPVQNAGTCSTVSPARGFPGWAGGGARGEPRSCYRPGGSHKALWYRAPCLPRRKRSLQDTAT